MGDNMSGQIYDSSSCSFIRPKQGVVCMATTVSYYMHEILSDTGCTVGWRLTVMVVGYKCYRNLGPGIKPPSLSLAVARYQSHHVKVGPVPCFTSQNLYESHLDGDVSLCYSRY